MEDLRITPRVLVPAAELSESFVRSSGPGGQHVNKVSSKVELRWQLTASRALTQADKEWLMQRLASKLTQAGELMVSADEHRDQTRNRAEARTKLAALVRAALVRPKARRATKPSKSSVRRRIEGKRRQGERKAFRRDRGD